MKTKKIIFAVLLLQIFCLSSFAEHKINRSIASNLWAVESIIANETRSAGIEIYTYDKSRKINEYMIDVESFFNGAPDSIAPDAALVNSKEFVINGHRLLLVEWHQGAHASAIGIFDPERSNPLLYKKVSDGAIDVQILDDEIIINYFATNEQKPAPQLKNKRVILKF